MIGEIVAAHRFMVVVVSCAQFSCGGGGGGIAFTLLDNCKATIDGQEIRSSVITPSKRPPPPALSRGELFGAIFFGANWIFGGR